MELNISDYLTEDEKKSIAVEVFRDMCCASFATDYERIVSNAAYYSITQMTEFSGDRFNSDLKSAVNKVVSSLSAHTVFKAPDAWDRDGNSNYHLLKEVVLSRRQSIESKIDELVNDMTLPESFELYIEDEVREMVIKRLFGDKS